MQPAITGKKYDKIAQWWHDQHVDSLYAVSQLERAARLDEIEAAALFAVASFRKVELAQILYASDDLSGEFWDSRNWHSKVEVSEKLLELAIYDCLKL